MNKIILKLAKIYIRVLFPEKNEVEFKDSRFFKFLILYTFIILLSLLVMIVLIYN